MTPARLLTLPFLLIFTLLLGSCATAKTDLDNCTLALGSVSAIGGVAPSPAVDRYLAFRAKKKKTGATGFIQLSRDLWKPFRFEVTGGFINSAKTSDIEGFFCTELDVRGSDPLQFYTICANPVNNGMQVFVSSHTGTLGQLFFAGALIVDFAFDHDGSNLVFLAKPHGDLNYQTVATLPMSTQNSPLLPSVGVNGFSDGAEVGFDHFRVVSNGIAPSELSSQQIAARDLWDAVDFASEALDALDGIAPDMQAVSSGLANTLIMLDFKIANLSDLNGTPVFKKYKGKLSSARAAVLAAQKAVSKNMKNSVLYTKQQLVMRRLLETIWVLDPI